MVGSRAGGQEHQEDGERGADGGHGGWAAGRAGGVGREVERPFSSCKRMICRSGNGRVKSTGQNLMDDTDSEMCTASTGRLTVHRGGVQACPIIIPLTAPDRVRRPDSHCQAHRHRCKQASPSAGQQRVANAGGLPDLRPRLKGARSPADAETCLQARGEATGRPLARCPLGVVARPGSGVAVAPRRRRRRRLLTHGLTDLRRTPWCPQATWPCGSVAVTERFAKFVGSGTRPRPGTAAVELPAASSVATH